MTLEEFVNVLIESLSGKLGEGFCVMHKTVLKNNSVEYNGIVINDDKEKIAPVFYVEFFYREWRNGRPLEDIAGEIVSLFGEYKKNAENCIENVIDFKNFEQNVTVRLVNYEKNEKVLENALFDRVGEDLAVTYHYVSFCGDEMFSVRLNESICKMLNIPPETIKEKALENTMRIFPPDFKKLNSLIAEVMHKNGFSAESIFRGGSAFFEYTEKIPMYVLTNQRNLNGATSIIYKDILNRIAKVVGERYYILPSSINEVIIVPDNDMFKTDDLMDMVRSVNKECVASNEILSDRVYHYPEDRFEITAPV